VIHFDAVTLFPEMFDAITRSGVTRRAFENGIYELVLWNPRDFSSNAYPQWTTGHTAADRGW
jgi:tRNA (guanine37-N1)-methyltransferase